MRRILIDVSLLVRVWNKSRFSGTLAANPPYPKCFKIAMMCLLLIWFMFSPVVMRPDGELLVVVDN
jgi:p-aminobenzoyl-glutamate transporter AbgT